MSQLMSRSIRLSDAQEPLSGTVHYWWWTRITDAVHGRRDAVKGLPPVDADTVDTPTTLVLAQALHDACEGEIVQFHCDTASACIELRAAITRLEIARERVDELKSRSQPALTDGTLAQRQAGEERVSADVIAARRGAEIRHLRQAANSEVEQARAELSVTAVDVDRLAETVAAQHRSLVSRCGRLEAFYLRRFGIYHRSLLRRHPDRGQLITRLALTAPTRPDSVVTADTAEDIIASLNPKMFKQRVLIANTSPSAPPSELLAHTK